jgi:hypothetical protein
LAEQQSLGIYLVLVPPKNPVIGPPSWNTANVTSGPQT